MPSSAIRDVDYDAGRRELRVTFVSGRIYVYDRVPEDLHDAFHDAQSKGTFFNRFIRDRYPFRELIVAK